jgi:hypothetical protein
MKVDEMGVGCGIYWTEEKMQTEFWWGKEGKGLLGKPRRRGWDNIKMHLNLGWEGVDLIHVAGARFPFMAAVNKVTNLRVP